MTQRNVRSELLAILRDNAHTWLTTTDLSIQLYGADGWDDWRVLLYVRQKIWYLRRAGHQIRTRTATWERTRRGAALAYQLIDERVQEVVA